MRRRPSHHTNNLPQIHATPTRATAHDMVIPSPGPRIVEMRRVPINEAFMHPRHRRRIGMFTTTPNKPLPNTRSAIFCESDDINFFDNTNQSSTTCGKASDYEIDVFLDQYLFSKRHCKRMACKAVLHPPPAITYACMESHLLVREKYERAFNPSPSFPGAFFNYKIDTLWLDWHTFEYGKTIKTRNGFPYFGALRDMNVVGVENLALTIPPARLTGDMDHFEPSTYSDLNKTMAELVYSLKDLKKLILVVDYYRRDQDDPADVTFIEPIEVGTTIRRYRFKREYGVPGPGGTWRDYCLEAEHSNLKNVQLDIVKFEEYRVQFAKNSGVELGPALKLEYRVAASRSWVNELEEARRLNESVDSNVNTTSA